HSFYRGGVPHGLDGDGVLSRRSPLRRDSADAFVLAHACCLRYPGRRCAAPIGALYESAFLFYPFLSGSALLQRISVAKPPGDDYCVNRVLIGGGLLALCKMKNDLRKRFDPWQRIFRS